MINYAIAMGKVMNEIELKHTDYGLPYCPLVLLCYAPQENRGTTKATVKCCAFGATATRLVNERVKKNTLLLVEGSLGNMHFYDSNNVLVNGMTFQVNKYVIITTDVVDGKPMVRLKSIFQKKLYTDKDNEEDDN